MRKSGAFHFKDADEAQADYERIEEPEPLLFFFYWRCYKRGNIMVCKKGLKKERSLHPPSHPKNRIKGAAGTEMQTELVRLPSTEYNFFSPFILSSIV